jgi:hypothetical protein
MLFDFLKRFKDLNLEEVCEKSYSSLEFNRVFEKTYSDVYLLTHPFYSSYFEFLPNPKEKLDEILELLSESVIKASKRDKILAILTLESDSKYMLDEIIYEYLCKIYKIM